MQTSGSIVSPLFHSHRMPLWLRAGCFSFAYWLCALAGNFLSFQGGTFVSFWLPSGLYTAVLLLSPRKEWPALVLAACAGNGLFDLWHGTPVWVFLWFCIANTLHSVSAAWLLRGFAGRPAALFTLPNFIWFLIAGALLGPALGAVIGAATLVAAGFSDSFFGSWQTWLGSTGMAVLLFSPLILSWLAPRNTDPFSIERPGRTLEALVLFGGMIGLTCYLLVGNGGVSAPYDSRVLPFLLWAGLRFGTRGASAACALHALLMTFLVTQGYTSVPMTELMTHEHVFNWQIFLAVNALVGMIPAVVLSERDRTLAALHDSEVRFRHLTEAAFEGVCIVDRGRLTEVNDQLLAMNGFKREEMVGQPCTDFIAHESRAYVAGILQMGQQTIGEHKLLRKDGSSFYAEARTRIAKVGRRKVRMMAIRDISERKKSEDAYHRLNADLERRVIERTAELSAANKELEAFSYSVSHDLRAPLRHISGFAQMLKSETTQPSAEASRQIERIEAAVRRMTAIVDGLLRLTHLGRAELHKSSVSLNALIREICDNLAPDVRHRAIEWDIAKLPRVQADPGLLGEALANLLHNAVKYSSGRDPAKIEIGLAPQLAKAGEIALYVRDNGAGFDMRFVDKLFGICQRLHSDTEFEGTGVGLANVQRIIQRHGGRVWAEAKVNEGATFYFSLPYTS